MSYYSIGGAASLIQGSRSADKVFEWNGVDKTQFEANAIVATGTGVTPTLTVTPNVGTEYDNPNPNILNLAAGGTGQGTVIWLANDPIDFGSSEKRSILIDAVVDSTASLGYEGFCFLGDAVGSFHGYAIHHGTAAGWRARVDAGTPVTNGTTQSAAVTGNSRSHVTMHIEAQKPAGAPPRFTTFTSGAGATTPATNPSMVRLLRSEFGGEPAPASWNGLACDRWGFSLQASGGNFFGDLGILSLRVYRL